MPEKEKPWRCFITLNLPEHVLTAIEDIQKDLRRQRLFTGVFTDRKNMHITLKYMGDINPPKALLVKEKLHSLNLKKVLCSLSDLGVTSESFVRSVWLSIDSKSMIHMQKAIDESLIDLFLREDNWNPRMTIARVNTSKDKEALFEYLKKAKFDRLEFELTTFSLKRSILTPKGPVYEVIEEYDMS